MRWTPITVSSSGYSVNQITGELSSVSNISQGPSALVILPVGNQTLWDPGLVWPTPATIVYGTALSGTQLDATAKVAGTFKYSPKAGTILGAGSQRFSSHFHTNGFGGLYDHNGNGNDRCCPGHAVDHLGHPLSNHLWNGVEFNSA